MLTHTHVSSSITLPSPLPHEYHSSPVPKKHRHSSGEVALLEVDQDWSMASLQPCGFSEPLHCAASHWNDKNL